MFTKTKQKNLSKSRSALRRFIRELILTLGEIDPEAIRWVYLSVARCRSIRQFEKEVVGSVLETGHHEFRLNNAGFKLFVSVDNTSSLRAYVGGDQTDFHADAYLVISLLLAKQGLMPEDRIGHFSPVCPEWVAQNWDKMGRKTRIFVMRNLELLPENVSALIDMDLPAFLL